MWRAGLPLRSLSLCANTLRRDGDDPAAAADLSLFPDLQRLTLRFGRDRHEAAQDNIARVAACVAKLSALTSLTIHNAHPGHPTEWTLPDSCTRLDCDRAFIVRARGLRDLTVEYPAKDGGALAELLSSNPALTALHITWGDSPVFSDDVAALLLKQRALTELSVQKPPLSLAVIVQLPAALGRLRSLSLVVPTQMASSDCVALLAAFRSLESCRFERHSVYRNRDSEEETKEEETRPLLPPLTAAVTVPALTSLDLEGTFDDSLALLRTPLLERLRLSSRGSNCKPPKEGEDGKKASGYDERGQWSPPPPPLPDAPRLIGLQLDSFQPIEDEAVRALLIRTPELRVLSYGTLPLDVLSATTLRLVPRLRALSGKEPSDVDSATLRPAMNAMAELLPE